jgi:hypothetical protein
MGLDGTWEQPFWVPVVMLGCTQAVGFLLHVISLERGMRIMEQEKMHIYQPRIVSVPAASEMALYITPRKLYMSRAYQITQTRGAAEIKLCTLRYEIEHIYLILGGGFNSPYDCVLGMYFCIEKCSKIDYHSTGRNGRSKNKILRCVIPT